MPQKLALAKSACEKDATKRYLGIKKKKRMQKSNLINEALGKKIGTLKYHRKLYKMPHISTRDGLLWEKNLSCKGEQGQFRQ